MRQAKTNDKAYRLSANEIGCNPTDVSNSTNASNSNLDADNSKKVQEETTLNRTGGNSNDGFALPQKYEQRGRRGNENRGGYR